MTIDQRIKASDAEIGKFYKLESGAINICVNVSDVGAINFWNPDTHTTPIYRNDYVTPLPERIDWDIKKEKYRPYSGPKEFVEELRKRGFADCFYRHRSDGSDVYNCMRDFDELYFNDYTWKDALTELVWCDNSEFGVKNEY